MIPCWPYGDKGLELEVTCRLSKPIIDEIDKVLAKHYGFTEEELDFIIKRHQVSHG